MALLPKRRKGLANPTPEQIEAVRKGLWALKSLEDIARELGTHEGAIAELRGQLMAADPALRAFRRSALRSAVPSERSERRLAIGQAIKSGLTDKEIAIQFGCSSNWVNLIRREDHPETISQMARDRLVKMIERGLAAGQSTRLMLTRRGVTPELIDEVRARLDCPSRPAKVAAPIQVPDGVDRHAAALIREGGFWSLSERLAKNGEPIACLPLIPPPRELVEAAR